MYVNKPPVMSQPVEQDPARRLGRLLACLIPIGLGHLGAIVLLTIAWPKSDGYAFVQSSPTPEEGMILMLLMLMFFTTIIVLAIEFSSRADRRLSSYKTGFILNIVGTYIFYGLSSSQILSQPLGSAMKPIATVIIAISFLALANFLAYSFTMRTFSRRTAQTESRPPASPE